MNKVIKIQDTRPDKNFDDLIHKCQITHLIITLIKAFLTSAMAFIGIIILMVIIALCMIDGEFVFQAIDNFGFPMVFLIGMDIVCLLSILLMWIFHKSLDKRIRDARKKIKN